MNAQERLRAERAAWKRRLAELARFARRLQRLANDSADHAMERRMDHTMEQQAAAAEMAGRIADAIERRRAPGSRARRRKRGPTQ